MSICNYTYIYIYDIYTCVYIYILKWKSVSTASSKCLYRIPHEEVWSALTFCCVRACHFVWKLIFRCCDRQRAPRIGREQWPLAFAYAQRNHILGSQNIWIWFAGRAWSVLKVAQISFHALQLTFDLMHLASEKYVAEAARCCMLGKFCPCVCLKNALHQFKGHGPGDRFPKITPIIYLGGGILWKCWRKKTEIPWCIIIYNSIIVKTEFWRVLFPLFRQSRGFSGWWSSFYSSSIGIIWYHGTDPSLRISPWHCAYP